MKSLRPLLKTLCLIITVNALTPAHATDSMTTVPTVDLTKYMGLWHEIARIDHGFQRGCYNSSAEYSFRKDGDVRVINSCSKKGRATRKEAEGRAWVTDSKNNAKLRVQFFLSSIKIGFLSGNYWIIDLAEDYSYVMVGEPSRKYFWLLSRSPKMDKVKVDQLVDKAVALGFDRQKILFNEKINGI